MRKKYQRKINFMHFIEARLNSRRFRWGALLIGFLLGTLLFLLRGAYSKATPEKMMKPETETEVSMFSEDDEDKPDTEVPIADENPLMAPFYPTFDNIMYLRSLETLKEYMYGIDETAYVYYEDLSPEILLAVDLHTPISPGTPDEPALLIFHTHAQEAFIDSRPGEQADTIVGVGAVLAEILASEYGITVVHDVGHYDTVNGREYREGSYERMEPAIAGLLEKYPSIAVTVDLHRDGVPDNVHLVTEMDGVPTARIMFFNGITRLNENNQPVALPALPNPYVQENLALSLRLQLTANTLYPGFARKIYIRPYRYSLHFRPLSMLVEVGANTNTVAEAKNAMRPLAEILMRVLTADKDAVDRIETESSGE